jgi:hypothetical protein
MIIRESEDEKMRGRSLHIEEESSHKVAAYVNMPQTTMIHYPGRERSVNGERSLRQNLLLKLRRLLKKSVEILFRTRLWHMECSWFCHPGCVWSSPLLFLVKNEAVQTMPCPNRSRYFQRCARTP